MVVIRCRCSNWPAGRLPSGSEALQARPSGELRTIYLKNGRLVGFQLAGDIRAAGILRTLAIQGGDVRPLKGRLLDPDFGQGMMVWQAITPMV